MVVSRNGRNTMLKDKNSSAIVAVKDLERARAFYSDVLELNLADTAHEGMLGYRTGATWTISCFTESKMATRAGRAMTASDRSSGSGLAGPSGSSSRTMS